VEAVNALNASLSRDLLEDHFVTLVLVVLTPGTGEVAIVNAGHLPPLLGNSDGDVVDVAFDESGWPLGIDGDTTYHQCKLVLDPGEIMALYTDGVNESLNLAGQMYGIDRLREHIRTATADLTQMGAAIIDDIREYGRGSMQSDDMCLICFSRQ
jgi:sigma-B regulation protein RsbU (phosphoserine phosphatase)